MNYHFNKDVKEKGMESEEIKENKKFVKVIDRTQRGLQNEYALIALSMEKKLDENGEKIYKSMMVYDWIDRMRAMGLEQSFMRREEDPNRRR